MHAIKSSARRQAWRNQNGEDAVYNLWGRASNNPRSLRKSELSGVEAGSEPAQTASDPELSHTNSHPEASGTGSQPRLHQPATTIGFGGDVEHLRLKIADTDSAEEPHGSGNAFFDGSVTVEATQDRTRRRQMRKSKILGFRNAEESDPGNSPPPHKEGSPGVRKCANWSSNAMLKKCQILLANMPYLLLPCIIVGFVVRYTHQSALTIFTINFLAIIPSNVMLAFAVEEVMLHIGDISGGLLSMSFSNATQLITSVLLLRTQQIDILQASLLGAILQNLLLMTGLCFFVGGVGKQDQMFNARRAHTIGVCLLLAVLSLVVPTLSRLLGGANPAGVAAQSRGTAIVIMISYGLWLLFQLKTNRSMFREDEGVVYTGEAFYEFAAAKRAGDQSDQTTNAKHDADDADIAEIGDPVRANKRLFERPKEHHVVVSRSLADMLMRKHAEGELDEGAALQAIALISLPSTAQAGVQAARTNDPPLPTTSNLLAAIVVGATFTTLLAFNTQFLTDSIQSLVTDHGLTTSFIGIVILPLVSNDITVLRIARRDNMDMCLALTLERCMQTSLLVVPLVVLVAWGLQIEEMTLDFDGFSVAALFGSIVIVTYVVSQGRSNWLVAALLVKVFIIVGLAAFWS